MIFSSYFPQKKDIDEFKEKYEQFCFIQEGLKNKTYNDEYKEILEKIFEKKSIDLAKEIDFYLPNSKERGKCGTILNRHHNEVHDLISQFPEELKKELDEEFRNGRIVGGKYRDQLECLYVSGGFCCAGDYDGKHKCNLELKQSNGVGKATYGGYILDHLYPVDDIKTLFKTKILSEGVTGIEKRIWLNIIIHLLYSTQKNEDLNLGPNLFVRCNNHNKNGKHKEYWDKFNGDGSKIEEINL